MDPCWLDDPRMTAVLPRKESLPVAFTTFEVLIPHNPDDAVKLKDVPVGMVFEYSHCDAHGWFGPCLRIQGGVVDFSTLRYVSEDDMPKTFQMCREYSARLTITPVQEVCNVLHNPSQFSGHSL